MDGESKISDDNNNNNNNSKWNDKPLRTAPGIMLNDYNPEFLLLGTLHHGELFVYHDGGTAELLQRARKTCYTPHHQSILDRAETAQRELLSVLERKEILLQNILHGVSEGSVVGQETKEQLASLDIDAQQKINNLDLLLPHSNYMAKYLQDKGTPEDYLSQLEFMLALWTDATIAYGKINDLKHRLQEVGIYVRPFSLISRTSASASPRVVVDDHNIVGTNTTYIIRIKANPREFWSDPDKGVDSIYTTTNGNLPLAKILWEYEQSHMHNGYYWPGNFLSYPSHSLIDRSLTVKQALSLFTTNIIIADHFKFVPRPIYQGPVHIFGKALPPPFDTDELEQPTSRRHHTIHPGTHPDVKMSFLWMDFEEELFKRRYYQCYWV
jgi:hypothetical protein